MADHLAPLKEGRFSYGANGFRFDGLARTSPAELQELFKPIRRQLVTDTRGYRLSKKEIEAQLRLYGASCSGVRSMRVGEMRDLMARMVKEGEV